VREGEVHDAIGCVGSRAQHVEICEGPADSPSADLLDCCRRSVGTGETADRMTSLEKLGDERGGDPAGAPVTKTFMVSLS